MRIPQNNMATKKWYSFMATNEWAILMSIARILTFIMIILICIYLFNNVESVKMLLDDPCQICMNKTGASCFVLNYP